MLSTYQYYRLKFSRLDNKAVTAIEYAIIAAFIATVIVVSVSSVGTKLPGIFNKVSSEL